MKQIARRARHLLNTCSLLGLFFHREDGGKIFFRNVRLFLTVDTSLYSRRYKSSSIVMFAVNSWVSFGIWRIVKHQAECRNRHFQFWNSLDFLTEPACLACHTACLRTVIFLFCVTTLTIFTSSRNSSLGFGLDGVMRNELSTVTTLTLYGVEARWWWVQYISRLVGICYVTESWKRMVTKRGRTGIDSVHSVKILGLYWFSCRVSAAGTARSI